MQVFINFFLCKFHLFHAENLNKNCTDIFFVNLNYLFQGILSYIAIPVQKIIQIMNYKHHFKKHFSKNKELIWSLTVYYRYSPCLSRGRGGDIVLGPGVFKGAQIFRHCFLIAFINSILKCWQCWQRLKYLFSQRARAQNKGPEP